MQKVIQHLKETIKGELPHSDIRKEGLDSKTLALLIEEEANAKAQFEKYPPKVCAIMIALYPHQGKIYVPMMQRPTRSRTHPGQIAFPGGKREENDSDLIETAIREMSEEVGVTVSRENIIGLLSPVYIPPSNSLVTPVLGFLDKKPQYTPSPIEVDRVLDISLEELADPTNKKAKKVILTNGDYFSMPAFAVQDVFIWGGTARMIMELNKMLS